MVVTPIFGIKKQHIYFGAFLSNLYKDELCFKAAIDTAVQLVNENDTLLKGFHLKIKYFDNFVSISQHWSYSIYKWTFLMCAERVNYICRA